MAAEPVRPVATPSQTVGPFFHFGLADNSTLGCLVRPDTKGERIRLTLRVLDGDGVPVPDSLLEIWQADADGHYVRPGDPSLTMAPTGFCGFGRLATGADGGCTFETIRPGRVGGGAGEPQAAHVNICLFARGLLRQLFTRVYFEDGEGLDTDPILSTVPAERRPTLIARRAGGSDWALDIRLQGDGETVFFDL